MGPFRIVIGSFRVVNQPKRTDGSITNTVIANCEIVKPRVAAAEHNSQLNEEARSPYVKKFKTSYILEREPLVLSGGKDKTVVLWSIHDHISTLATQLGITKSGGSDDKPTESPRCIPWA
uniref:Uncharacterized protein n=1 Tax=Tanacetum cinerariifolium TaxID=118510 RepID=A0A699HIM0_TANCI|nr:hypothetical protein [Tanacetum cinerariifolium]